MDESDAESNCSSDFSPRQTPFNAISKHRSNYLLRSFDSTSPRKQTTFVDVSQLDDNNYIDTDDTVEEIHDLTAELCLSYSQHELKAQLLKECGQTETLPFDEVYSAR